MGHAYKPWFTVVNLHDFHPPRISISNNLRKTTVDGSGNPIPNHRLDGAKTW